MAAKPPAVNEWTLRKTDGGLEYWEVRFGGYWVTLEARPPYCDRGHYYAKASGGTLDEADGFPRYYMDLARAKDELLDWMIWRIERDAGV